MLPISSRTHINVAELLMIEMTLKYITRERWRRWGINTSMIEGITIITDSQNCLNLIQLKDHTNDEILTKILQNITNHYDAINERWEEGSIEFQWVPSHNESKMNDDVDDVAKMASKIIQITGLNEKLTTHKGKKGNTSIITVRIYIIQSDEKGGKTENTDVSIENME